MKPRIETLAAGITREIIAEQTHLFYDPMTKDVSVSFQYRPSIFMGDDCQGPAGDWSVLGKRLADVAERTFGTGLIDPITNEPLDHVSGAGIVTLIKAAFPQLYDESVDTIAGAT
jgi:hypothetical protein